MWIDDEGVAHTAALPDPASVMQDDFREGLDAISASDGDTLRSVVTFAETRALEEDWSHLSRSAAYVGTPAPAGLLCSEVGTPEDVARAIGRVQSRWRLDVVMALDDYLDRQD